MPDTRIFICYRKDDVGWATACLVRDALAASLGANVAFMDDSIPVGVNWRRFLSENVGACKLLLALIGKQWLHVQDEAGNRRLDNPDDFVRFEVRTALERNIPIVPLFIDGAPPPPSGQLPEDIRELVDWQGFGVRQGAYFRGDAAALVDQLRPLLGALPPTLAQPSHGVPPPTTIAAPTRSFSGFTFIGNETFACENDVEGTKQFTVPVYRCDAFAQAIRLGNGARAIDTEFVLLPPPDYDNAKPTWTGKPFLIARTCVSQRVYDALGGKHDTYNWPDPMRPANQVSWNDAQAWFKQRALVAVGLRLPAEAEWEFACRAGTQTEFCFGDGATVTSQIVNFNGNNPTGGAPTSEYRKCTVEVGSLPGNAFGLHEVHGNLWEWCEDLNEPGASLRVFRGGGWDSFAANCRSASRNGSGPGYRVSSLGFRPARSVD